MTAKKAYILVPDSVKLPAPDVSQGEHKGKSVRIFINTCKTYLKSIGVTDKNIQARFAKLYMTQTARTWCNSQGYDETTLIFPVLQSHIIMYFVPSDYACRARQALVTCKIRNRNTTQYTDAFCKQLVKCKDVTKEEAKQV